MEYQIPTTRRIARLILRTPTRIRNQDARPYVREFLSHVFRFSTSPSRRLSKSYDPDIEDPHGKENL